MGKTVQSYIMALESEIGLWNGLLVSALFDENFCVNAYTSSDVFLFILPTTGSIKLYTGLITIIIVF